MRRDLAQAVDHLNRQIEAERMQLTKLRSAVEADEQRWKDSQHALASCQARLGSLIAALRVLKETENP